MFTACPKSTPQFPRCSTLYPTAYLVAMQRLDWINLLMCSFSASFPFISYKLEYIEIVLLDYYDENKK